MRDIPAPRAASSGDLVDALIRESLKRTGRLKTLEAYDMERPRGPTAVTTRSGITRGLRIERLVKRHQETGQPLPSLLYLVVDYLANRGSKGGGSAHQIAANRGPGTGAGATTTAAIPAPPARLAPAPTSPPPVQAVAVAAGASGFNLTTGRRTPTSVRGNSLGGTARGASHATGHNVVAQDIGEDASITTAKPLSETAGSSGLLAKAAISSHPDNHLLVEHGCVPDTGVAQANTTTESHGFKFSADDNDDFDCGSFQGAGRTLGRSHRLAQVGVQLSLEEARDCRALVLGKGAFSDAWAQGLYWTSEEELRFGLWQESGGPCGVIAAVQAYVLVQLLYEMPTSADPESQLDPSDGQRDTALVHALAHILWQAGQGRRAVVLLRKGAAMCMSRSFENGLVKYSFTDKTALVEFLTSRLSAIKESRGCFVVLFMYSTLFSRGLEESRADMDVATNTMIAAHGYCSQEIVNLMLTGKAHSNVFDGQLEGVMDKPMKGIYDRCQVGYLTLIEALNEGYLTVGDHFKSPELPIFVICSESHYSVLFGVERALCASNITAEPFDLYYYDELGRQDERIRLTVDPEPATPPTNHDLTPPLEHCIRTRWPGASVDWNGTDELL